MTTIREIDNEKIKAKFLTENQKITGTFALIEGEESYIITEKDFVHEIIDNTEKAEFSVFRDEKGKIYFTPEGNVEMTLEELKECLGNKVDIRKWGHYFGIKDRVYDNYLLLQESAKAIKADMEFPEWKR